MGRVILDTSIVVAVHRGTLDWDTALADDDDAAIAVITATELLAGVPVADGRLRERRRTIVERTIEALPLEPYDLDVARVHADLLVAIRRAGCPRGAHDLIIAATARATDRTVVTLDADGFGGLPGVSVRVPA